MSKRNIISQIISSGNAKILFIQESKLKIMDSIIISSLWRNQEVGWSSSNANGQSGGIITLWKKDFVDPIYSFKRDGFLRLKMRWKNNMYYVINAYFACCIILKMKIWSELLDMKNKMVDGIWILGGDFNSTSNSYERKGSLFMNRKFEHRKFKSFIKELNLVDLPCSGNYFSWFSRYGKSMRRIDKFFLFDSLIER